MCVLAGQFGLVLDGFKVSHHMSELSPPSQARRSSGADAGALLLSFSGAWVRRVIDRSGARIPEHAHDWPVLSLFVLGSYLNQTELGAQFVAGPSAVLYRAGAAHRNTVAALGFEQIEIEFDPAWLGYALPDAPVTLWLGGQAGRQARQLARACEGSSEDRLRALLHQFLAAASRHPSRVSANWIGAIARRLAQDTTLRIRDLAREADRHPSWVGSAYRHATGEGLQETAARFRVERATYLLRETGKPQAAVAFEAGFCDQSHMNRTFHRLLGRSPVAVREERRCFRQAAS